MAVHTDLLLLLSAFSSKNFNPSRGIPLPSDIIGMRSSVVRSLSRMIQMPNSTTPEDIAKWGNRLGRKNHSLFEFLKDPDNKEKVSDYLYDQLETIFKHQVFEEMSTETAKKLKASYSREVSNLISVLNRRFEYAEKFTEISPDLIQGREAKGAFSKSLKPYFKLSAQELKRKILAVLKAPPEPWIANVRKLYQAGRAETAEEILRKRSVEVNNIFKQLKNLPLPLQNVLNSSSSSMTEVLEDVMFRVRESDRKSSGAEYIQMFRELRSRIEEARGLQVDISDSMQAQDRAYEIRNPDYLARMLSEKLASRDYLGIQKLVEQRVNKGNVRSMAKAMKAVSPALARLVYYVKTKPNSLNTFVMFDNISKEYKQEQDEKELRAFKSSPERVARAILENKLQDMQSKGFKLDKYMNTARGYRAMSYVLNELMDKLLSDSSNLPERVLRNAGLQNRIENLDAASQLDSSKISGMLKNKAREIFKKGMEKKIRNLLMERGKGLKGFMPNHEYEELVGRLTIKYLDYSSNELQDSVQAIIRKNKEGEEEIKRFSVRPDLIDLSRNASFQKSAKRMGFTTVESMREEIVKELKRRHEQGKGSLKVTRYAMGLVG